ncbi:hypothetical protein SELMODRAFT_167160 [Selaginella moellendorffii]|uniref:Pectinesterase n=1 Tax=Selaginella moellendorffii TaxID=88036 RepID=D8R1X2_SELML|nr:probable pectinesterase 68 [Selaginella moellendorffii]EFJ33967.1 hypothetical protein SELMODRAFT_167160 [Selaginella moellendorffii]|eukprot:XP_002965129.1 probable pectinesterase 68 [Selaginella moellendorffii]
MAARDASSFLAALFLLSRGSRRISILVLSTLILSHPRGAAATRNLLQSFSTEGHLAARILVVDQSGNGDFVTVQDAVNAIPDGNDQRVTIRIGPGIYWEKVVVPATKPFLTFQGAGIDRSLIVWNSTASDLGPDGQPLTAYRTASVTIVGANFIARDISFQNTAPPPPPGVNGRQAAAFRISGDMAAFYNCGFYGAQDTLCDDVGRHYFKGCFIQGSIDFIFGNGRSLYEQCELHSIADSYGSVAAQDRQSQTENTGFSFVNCKVTGTGILYLGRAMGPYSRIVYSNSYFDNIIDVRGWDDWDHDASRDRTVSFGQYKCYGPGATSSLRVPWARELSDMEVTPFLSLSFVDGTQWLPST